MQASSLAVAQAAVKRVGGRITHELEIIDSVGAQLTSSQVVALRQDPQLTVFEDVKAKVAGYVGQLYVVNQTQATRLHAAGITGKGVTIAFVDTGVWADKTVTLNSAKQTAYLQGYDAIQTTTGTNKAVDENGHGTNVTSIATSSILALDGTYSGIAPDAGRIAVKAFDRNGKKIWSPRTMAAVSPAVMAALYAGRRGARARGS